MESVKILEPQMKSKSEGLGKNNSLTSNLSLCEFECNLCDEIFSNKGALGTHMKFHSGYKYKCEICKCKYITKLRLNQHLNRQHKHVAKCSKPDEGKEVKKNFDPKVFHKTDEKRQKQDKKLDIDVRKKSTGAGFLKYRTDEGLNTSKKKIH
ncbi:hypothetical protein PVAND_016997 [Polypedilum vanderplanki]|uniref:C2H2-type domain-containing protein n=1 Tax=Polypedilum vanderplanki TaxID=319348 RepID=A0A9J6BGX5_POLVA|nr:hypothetical protein PVAND_016997 [Polypedilum vanderplanki]